jgi:hypothetical protein
MAPSKRHCLAYTRRLHIITLTAGYGQYAVEDWLRAIGAMIGAAIPHFAQDGMSIEAYDSAYVRTHWQAEVMLDYIRLSQACYELACAYTSCACIASLRGVCSSLEMHMPSTSSRPSAPRCDSLTYHATWFDARLAGYLPLLGNAVSCLRITCMTTESQFRLVRVVSESVCATRILPERALHITVVPFHPLPSLSYVREAAKDATAVSSKSPEKDPTSCWSPRDAVGRWIEAVQQRCRRGNSSLKMDMAPTRQVCPACLDPPTTQRWLDEDSVGEAEDVGEVEHWYEPDLEATVREMIDRLDSQ